MAITTYINVPVGEHEAFEKRERLRARRSGWLPLDLDDILYMTEAELEAVDRVWATARRLGLRSFRTRPVAMEEGGGQG